MLQCPISIPLQGHIHSENQCREDVKAVFKSLSSRASVLTCTMPDTIHQELHEAGHATHCKNSVLSAHVLGPSKRFAFVTPRVRHAILIGIQSTLTVTTRRPPQDCAVVSTAERLQGFAADEHAIGLPKVSPAECL